MKNTNKSIRMITLFIMGVVITATIVRAQSGRNDRQPELPDSANIQKIIKQLDVELEMTDEQESKISALFIAHFDQLKSQREIEKPEMEQRKNAHEKDRKEFEASIKAELSKKQIKQFEQFSEKLRSEHQDRGNDRPRN